MADEEKASGPLAWIKTAKDKIRAFAYRGEPQRSERPRVGVALAGGFARGISHIGVLRVLREAGIPIDCVAGTNGGGLIWAAFFERKSVGEGKRGDIGGRRIIKKKKKKSNVKAPPRKAARWDWKAAALRTAPRNNDDDHAPRGDGQHTRRNESGSIAECLKGPDSY